MKKTAFISDILFTLLLSFLVSVVLFRCIGVRFIPSVLLGAICSTLTTLGIGAYLMHRRKRYFLKRSDETLKNKLLTHLALLSCERKTQFFRALFPDENVRAQNLRILTADTVYFLAFHFSPVTQDEVAAFTHLKTAKKKIVLCGEIEDSALSLCSRLQIGVQTGEAVYRLVRSKNALPTQFLGEETPQTKRAFRFRLCFAKSNSRRFLLCGTLILLASLLTPFPLYYWIFGLILLCVAACIRIFGYSLS